MGKNQKFISTSHQQVMSSHLLGSRASVHIVIASEDKCLDNECPPLAFVAEYDVL